MTPTFAPTIKWARAFLWAQGRDDLAERLPNDSCWPQIGQAVRDGLVPAEIVEGATQALIASGNGWACYCYCRYVQDLPEVRAALIASGNGWACYCYCLNVQDLPEVRAALIASGDGRACYYYCLNVQDHRDVRAVAERAGYTV